MAEITIAETNRMIAAAVKRQAWKAAQRLLIEMETQRALQKNRQASIEQFNPPTWDDLIRRNHDIWNIWNKRLLGK